MIIERDVPIRVDDGIELRADIFKPSSEQNERFPVIVTLGPYSKGLEWKTGFAESWNAFSASHPDALPGSTKSYMVWETVDPETWTKFGYAVIRVDSRGAGRSPGFLDNYSPKEIKDYYDVIEWAGMRSWSTGKVGICGISYFAINQWLVATLQPPHLTAMVAWEGSADFYRDLNRTGGILSNEFVRHWFDKQVKAMQHGNTLSPIDPWLNERVSGPTALSQQELEANYADPVEVPASMEWDCEWYRERSPVWSKVRVPFLSAANWGAMALHQRGNFSAFTEAASTQKWLEVHPGKHEEWFYLDYGVALQKRFLDHFLKGIDNDWMEQKPVTMNIRRPFSNDFEQRTAETWPLPNTKWTKLFFSVEGRSLTWTQPHIQENTTFDALGSPLILSSAPLGKETELTGPLTAKLFISSSTADADLFLTLQAFSPDGREVEFQGSHDPHTPLAQGWLRASHRKLDNLRSKPYQPYHTHDECWPLEPGTIYEVIVEIWATCIVLPAGFTLALQISGHDFERGQPVGPRKMDGSGPFLHTHPVDRPREKFGGKTTVHSGGKYNSYVLLPVIDT